MATKFEGQEFLKIGPTSTKKRLWITLLNKSYLNKYQINKGDVIGNRIIKPDNIKTLRRQKRNPRGRDTRIIIYPKTGRNAGKNTSLKRKTSCHQTGGFLNRYNFAHPGRDVVNQAGKVTPKLINQATGEINKIAQQRIDQVIR